MNLTLNIRQLESINIEAAVPVQKVIIHLHDGAWKGLKSQRHLCADMSRENAKAFLFMIDFSERRLYNGFIPSFEN